jgi:hypothetical protein
MTTAGAMKPTYVYGLIKADTTLPEGLSGLGPSGRVSTIVHGPVAAIVSDVPIGRPLGARGDLVAHETVLDAVASRAAVLPMRFAAVVEEDAVVEELLAPNQERFMALLNELEDRVQYTLTGRYEQDAVLREILEGDPQIAALREKIRSLPEDATYYDRVRLGELVVEALEDRREAEAAHIVGRLVPLADTTASNPLAAPEDVVNTAFLVERKRQKEFEDAVESVGQALVGRVRLRLLGPVAPYDFVDEE